MTFVSNSNKKPFIWLGIALFFATAIIIMNHFEDGRGFRFKRSRGKTGKGSSMSAKKAKRKFRFKKHVPSMLPKGGRFFR